MLQKTRLSRILSMLLVVIMLVSILPMQQVFAAGLVGDPNYPPVPAYPGELPDEGEYGRLYSDYIKFTNSQLLKDGSRESMLLYYYDDNQPLAEGRHISQAELAAGVDWDEILTQGVPFVPTKDKQLILDIAHYTSQETRVELCDENGQYLGLISHGISYGQRNPDPDFDYSTEDPDTKQRRADGELDEKLSNHIYWDGKYLDSETGEFLYPGQEADGAFPEEAHDFIIAFQPAGEKYREFRFMMKITVAYTDEAYEEAMAQYVEYQKAQGPQAPCGDGDPVYMVTGNFTWDYQDISVYGSEPLDFVRYYNAQNENDSEIGFGWRHNYLISLQINKSNAFVTMENGYKFNYNIYGDGSFNAPAGNVNTLTRIPDGYLFTEYDKTEYRFNTDGLLVSVTDVSGNVTSISRNGAEIGTVINDSGTLTFTYTGDKISRITDQTGRFVEYTYDDNDDLVSFLNADDNTIDYLYSGHLMTEISDFNGNTYLKNVYDGLGRVQEQFMADQGTSFFAYYPASGYSTITDPEGAVREYHYDQFQNITEVVDVNGGTKYEYENGRVVKITDRLENSTVYDYDEIGNVSSITYPDDTTELFEYNSLNLVTKATAKDGTVTLYGYDSNGNLTSHTDPRGNTSTFTYDSDNNMLTSTDPLSNTTTFTYDAKGNCLTQTDALDNVTTFEYDTQGRLIKQTNADTSTVKYEYTDAGKLVTTTDPNGKETSMLVNGNGFDEGNTDPMGFETTTEYNDQNKPISVTDPMGNTTTYEYDDIGQLIKTTDMLGNSVQYGYDLAGRMVSMTDARGKTWHYAYDKEGRMTGMTDPLGNITSTAYDDMGRTESTTNARNATTTYAYDDMGRTTKVTDALDGFSRNVYDDNGNLIEQYDKNNNKWEYTYDANNRMETAKDPLGYITTYHYDAIGRATKTVSHLGAAPRSEYDSMGRLVKSIDAEGNETVYKYDILGRLVKTTFADDTFTQSEYNDNGWLTKAIAQDGGETEYTYNDNGQVLTITDALDGVTEYVYDELGRTVAVYDALNPRIDANTVPSIAYTYDENGNLLTSTDAVGGVTTYIYDALNRVSYITDPMGGETITEYDSNGNVQKVVNPDGGIISYEYDLLDRLKSYTDTEDYTWSFTYDANGNTLTSKDGNGNVSSSEYDALNRAILNIDPEGGESSVEYDADGRMVKSTNPEGAKTFYEYDLNGNVELVTDALGNETAFTYDGMNRVLTTTDALGAVTTYSYTAIGAVATMKDALGGVKSYTYDLLGRLAIETNELGKSTEYTYDKLGRVLTVKNALGKSDTFTYDAAGRIKTVTDKNNNVTKYNYDANGNIIETIDALYNSSYFEYDAMNRLTKVTLARKDTLHNANENQITLYQYDHRGLVTKEINAAAKSIIYVYDGNGNMVSKTDADGKVTTFGFDGRNLVETINYSGGKNVAFQYNLNGELVKMVDWNGQTQFALDVLGRILSVNDHNSKITSYTYDDVGNQTSIAYPDNSTVNYTYDLLGRLTKVNEPNDTGTGKVDTIYAYDAASQLLSTAYPNSWTEFYDYDDVGQQVSTYRNDPKHATNKLLLRTSTYDAQGNVLTDYYAGVGAGQTEEKATYSYDALNRLVSENLQYGNKQNFFQYDSLGNLTYETGSGKLTDYKYNNLNQITKKTVDKDATYSYTYDNRGNLTKIVSSFKNTVTEQYTYDETNRMTFGKNVAGDTATYSYNGLGYLVGNKWTAKNVQDKVKAYVLDYTSPLKDVIMESFNGQTYRHVYGLNRISTTIYTVPNSMGSIVQNGRIKLYSHQDRLGSTRLLTNNSDGGVASYVDYTAWGDPIKTPVINFGITDNSLVQNYTGHPYDTTLGLYFAEARMYDAADRRFVSVDPITSSVSKPTMMVQYVYCSSNPVLFVDLSGKAIYLDSLNTTPLSGIKNDAPVQILRDGRNYVQMKSLVEFLGGTVSWDGKTGTAGFKLTKHDGTIVEKYFDKLGCYEKETKRFVEDGRTYLQLKDIADMLGYGQVLSWWNIPNQVESEVLIQRQMVNAPVIATRAGNQFNVQVYADFKGDIAHQAFAGGLTYAEIGMLGILEHLEKTVTADGKIDSFGIYKSMTVNIEILSFHETTSNAWTVVEKNDQQKYLSININAGEVRSNVSGNTINPETGVKSFIGKDTRMINAYDQNPRSDDTFTPFTEDSFKWMMAHEFTHVLGIGDAYRDDFTENWTTEVPKNGLMSNQNGALTPNEMEMIMLAWALDNRQNFYETTTTKGVVVPRSTAITSGFSHTPNP